MNSAEIDVALRRLVTRVFVIVAVIWFLMSASPVVLLFLFAIVLALALEPPVRLLSRRLPRWAAALVVLAAVGCIVAALTWLLVPVLVEQGTQVSERVPQYVDSVSERVQEWIDRQDLIPNDLAIGQGEVSALVPSAGQVLSRVGRFTITLTVGVVLLIVLASSVAYLLIDPRPMVLGYLSLFPDRLQDKAATAFQRSQQAVSGWLWSNVIVGAIEGVAAGLFLWWLGVPAPLLWAVLTFFAELVPKLGPYLMTVPPAVIALSIDPMKAVWVVVFFIALNEVTGDTIAPAVRGKTMQLHPVSLLFVVLALASIFGFWGALLATPLTGIFKAFYETFWLEGRQDQSGLHRRADEILG